MDCAPGGCLALTPPPQDARGGSRRGYLGAATHARKGCAVPHAPAPESRPPARTLLDPGALAAKRRAHGGGRSSVRTWGALMITPSPARQPSLQAAVAVTCDASCQDVIGPGRSDIRLDSLVAGSSRPSPGSTSLRARAVGR